MHRTFPILAGMMLAPTAAVAHPHVFIDAAIAVIFDDQGMVEAVRIDWTYDEFFSLAIIEDRALDPDYDGVLTPEAAAALSGFDMQWDADFPGDLYLTLNGEPVSLARPSDWSAGYQDGKITSTHTRRLSEPLAVADMPLIIKAYDPGFYTAYTIVGEPGLDGRGDCVAEMFTPDVDAADAALLAALAEIPASADIEFAYPNVGSSYAQELWVTCSAAF
jgi:ABC-type uncharacterized transport system substrate-binding protein